MGRIVRAVLGSFYSKTTYRDLAYRRKGIGAGFILILVILNFGPALVSIPLKIASGSGISALIESLPIPDVPRGPCIDAMSPGTARAGVTRAAFVGGGERGLRSVACVGERQGTRERMIAAAEASTLAFAPLVVILVAAPFLFVLAAVFVKSLLLKILAVFFTRRPDLAGAMRITAAASIPFAVVGFVLSITAIAIGSEGPLIAFPTWFEFFVWLVYALFGLGAAVIGGGEEFERRAG